MIEKKKEQEQKVVNHCRCDMNVQGKNVQYRKRASPDATPVRVSTRHIW